MDIFEAGDAKSSAIMWRILIFVRWKTHKGDLPKRFRRLLRYGQFHIFEFLYLYLEHYLLKDNSILLFHLVWAEEKTVEWIQGRKAEMN